MLLELVGYGWPEISEFNLLRLAAGVWDIDQDVMMSRLFMTFP